MRFHSGERDGKLRHHDIALVEGSSPPTDPAEHPQAPNRVAIEYATHEPWQHRSRF
jgi:catechol 2,3-dioxygenase